MNTLNTQDAVTPPPDDSIRLIPLTQGQFSIVDAADYEFLNQWKWYAYYSKFTKSYYAVRSVHGPGFDTNVKMSRIILGITDKDIFVDHKNRNTLDNRRVNLRPATRRQNAQNAKLRVDNSTGFKGVEFDKESGKYKTRIRINGKETNVGRYISPEDAARAYDFYALIYYGEFAVLNFPLDTSQ